MTTEYLMRLTSLLDISRLSIVQLYFLYYKKAIYVHAETCLLLLVYSFMASVFCTLKKKKKKTYVSIRNITAIYILIYYAL